MEYENALKSLAGMPLAKIGRAADLLWLQFGDLREVETRRGVNTVGEWAIHIQTSWRFVRNAQITLAVGDLYLFPNGDCYDWDAGGDSNFDTITRDFNDTLSSTSLLVQKTKCDGRWWVFTFVFRREFGLMFSRKSLIQLAISNIGECLYRILMASILFAKLNVETHTPDNK